MTNKSAASIQKHLEIKDIRDDVVILKNNGLRAILMTTCLNFALKSIEEQEAIVLRYQDFLNSLDFPIQILVVSRKFNIDPYLQSLREKISQQENELLRLQAAEYIDFVKGLTEMNNIMTDSFYLTIPYSPPVTRKLGFVGKLFGKSRPAKEKEESFQELKNSLWQRVEFISTGLGGIGIKAVPLGVNELIELFYKIYNPNTKEGPELERANILRIQ